MEGGEKRREKVAEKVREREQEKEAQRREACTRESLKQIEKVRNLIWLRVSAAWLCRWR